MFFQESAPKQGKIDERKNQFARIKDKIVDC